MLHLPLAMQTTGAILAEAAHRFRDRPFVVSGERRFSYAEQHARALRTAAVLSRRGVGKGSKVAILLPNSIEFLDIWFALATLGAIQVPLNTEYKPPQVAHVIERAQAQLIISNEQLWQALRSRLTSAPEVLYLGDLVREAQGAAPFTGDVEVSGADVSAVMNTSGTTGPSKGVLLPHAQQYILARNIAKDINLAADDVFYNFFPLYHNTSQAMIVLPAMLTGACVVLRERFSASAFWSDVERYKCTLFYYIGEILNILLKTTRHPDGEDTTLRAAWGIGLPPRVAATFSQRFRVALHTGYGSTEANVPVIRSSDAIPEESVGRPIPDFEVCIATADDQPLGAHEVGEILVRGRAPFSTMAGYDGNADATVAAWRNLWFHTGDAGRLDDEGNLYFVGRLRDVIRVRGENVAAADIEQAFNDHPKVLEVAAIAVPADIGGDDVKIVVVPIPGEQPTARELVESVRDVLPKYAVPRFVELVAELPKTETNKVQKEVLRATPFTEATVDLLGGRHG